MPIITNEDFNLYCSNNELETLENILKINININKIIYADNSDLILAKNLTIFEIQEYYNIINFNKELNNSNSNNKTKKMKI